MRTTSACAAVIGAVLCTACTLVEVDADIRAACSTRHDVEIEAAPAAASGEIDVDVEVELDLAAIDALAGLDAELRVEHVRLQPTSGIDDLVFVEAAHVTLASADPDVALPTVTIVACDGDCPAAAELLLPSELGDMNALQYATSGPLAIGATIRGELPVVPWTMDVEVCAAGHATTSGGL